MLLGDTGGATDRKLWIENRLRELAENFAIAVGGFAMMDNHLHLLLRLDPQIAEKLTDEDVVRRWGKLFPPRDKSRKALGISDDWVKAKLMDPNWIKKTRDRLQNLGWFMKCLKEPLARLANREDDVRGAFFEGRFKSIAILDEEALLATCVYIDLNPVAAGIAQVPESSEHTSIKQRVDHVREKRRLGDLKAGRRGSLEGSNHAKGLEDAHWLCPIENRRPLDSLREGMIEGFPLSSYLMLVDYSSRLFREGKARITQGLADIFTRLGTDSETWQLRFEQLIGGRLLGRFFSSNRERLRELATQRGVSRLANLAGCPAR
jgi:hypothetical protein